MKFDYKENPKGVLELAQSNAVGEACYRAGKLVEQAARAVPVPGASDRAVNNYRSRFATKRADVMMAGWKGRPERRAGAIVYNDHELEHVFGGRSRALYSAIQALDGVSVR